MALLAFLIFVSAIPAYVVGSINGAIITSISLYRKDIRKFGSGNPGLTNFYRVFGKGGSLLVIIIDVLKTVVPVLLGGWLIGRYVDLTFFGRAVSGFFVMLGHCFPVFYRFNGGKGVMALGTLLFIVDWRVALISWGVFVVTVLISRYVSLGAILGSAMYPVSLLILNLGGAKELVVAALCALLVIFRHRENIKRLVTGKESRFRFSRK
jgi:glycerol-3-phosphate acyltransferase PlsY